jgi:dTDP-4-dehydrorhamnose reductase
MNKGIVNWVLSNNSKTINGYKNYIFSGISLHTLCHSILHIINMSEFPSGIYHAAGPCISKYDFIKNIAEVFDLTINLQPVFNPQINRSLNSSCFWRMLNQEMPSTEHMIKNIFLEYSSYPT